MLRSIVSLPALAPGRDTVTDTVEHEPDWIVPIGSIESARSISLYSVEPDPASMRCSFPDRPGTARNRILKKEG